jgi:cation diffusion facilitator CzcD-associated flavoprotein CzcO
MTGGANSMTKATDVAIIGAGPYGLSLAAHLRSRGREPRVFGDPMKLWRTQMPKGMRLKSEGFASSLYDPGATFTLAHFCADNSIPYADVGLPVALDTFARYGMAFQARFVPDAENRTVTGLRRAPNGFELSFADGEVLAARRVVVAVGVAHFAYLPPVLRGFSPDLVSHTSDHHALDKFSGRDVAVIGAGASALDVAALVHAAGANTALVARAPGLAFHNPPLPQGQRRPLTSRMRWPTSGIGSGWKSYLYAEVPQAFRHLPAAARVRIVRNHLGPAPCWFTKQEVVGKVTMCLSTSLEKVEAEGDRVRLYLRGSDGATSELVVDHVIAGTGYRPDLQRIAFIPDDLRESISKVSATPSLSGSFESSIPGLYFVGPISANTFGPLCRFAFGAGFAAERVTGSLKATTH